MKKLLFPVLILFSSLLSAQITAPGSKAERSTSYTSGTANNPVFIWCASTSPAPELIAESPGGSAPFDFVWTKWDETLNSFSIAVSSDISVMSSTISGLSEGGYKVRITDGGVYDISLFAWVHIDSPVSEISLEQSICNQVTLRGRALADDYYYEDIVSGDPILLPNDIEFVYSSDPVSLIGNPTFHTYNVLDYGLKVLNSPPLEDLDYTFEVTDSFTCSTVSSFFYESIHVKAEFEIDPTAGESPLEVFITDQSVRALNYTWRFGDDTISNEIDPHSHTYYIPGIYTMSLAIESDRGCIDSMSIGNIVVDPSSLNIPNVFTPNGDSSNEFFVVESTSLKHLEVQIFSKGGKRVYFFSGAGDTLKEWQGWDGKIGASNASPGIYFYIIKARGWDNVVYDHDEHRGFVYLYR